LHFLHYNHVTTVCHKCTWIFYSFFVKIKEIYFFIGILHKKYFFYAAVCDKMAVVGMGLVEKFIKNFFGGGVLGRKLG